MSAALSGQAQAVDQTLSLLAPILAQRVGINPEEGEYELDLHQRAFVPKR